ncbi:hypothetical protein KC887_05300 [Candidatus Kaiserbacteria bacterium]|nr:hypothetical protein [Candidatus Kaiserbacteria bacterium]
MARKAHNVSKDIAHLRKTRSGRYGAIVGVHTQLRYIPDRDGLIYVEDSEDLAGFLATDAWELVTEDVLTDVNSDESEGDDGSQGHSEEI